MSLKKIKIERKIPSYIFVHCILAISVVYRFGSFLEKKNKTLLSSSKRSVFIDIEVRKQPYKMKERIF